MSERSRPLRPARQVEHAVVYRREDEFASHPYVRGFWEDARGHLTANFSLATVDYRGDPDRLAHIGLVRSAGGRRAVTIRSEDRGRTWRVVDADPRRPNNDVMAPRPGIDGRPGGLPEVAPVDFTDRNVLVSNFNHQYLREDPQLTGYLAWLDGLIEAPERRVFWRVSKDGGASWSRSAMLPLDGLYSLSAVESCTVRPDGECLLFLSGVASRGDRSRPLVYRSVGGGSDFHFLSFIVPREDPLAGGTVQMYPRGLVLPDGRLLCTLRIDRDWAGDMWTHLYASDDGGRTWSFLSRVNDFGAPAAPLLLSDGRLVMVYANRLQPSVRAVVSEDGGRSFGPELLVRDDGGSWDVGYPRAWEAAPGVVGVLYYWNTRDDPIQVHTDRTPPWGAGGVRFIARSFFAVD
ncbi:MAG: sialidase family protein [Pseudomonadota bacterium]